MIRKQLFLGMLLLTLPAAAQHCTHTVSGTIQTAGNVALPDATVSLSPLDIQTISAEDGSFKFENLCAGLYKLTVYYVGFDNRSISVKIPSLSKVTITLVQSSTQLEDVVIEGERRSASVSQTTGLLQKDDLEALHGKPLGESLKEIPGVSAIQTGPSIFKPVIHGLHSQRILILNNGIRQEGQQWGIEHAPEVDPYIASNIEVVKGAETVRYGSDAIGGVIIINPPPLHEVKKLGGELNMGLMSNNRMGVFSAMLEGNIEAHNKWTWRAQSSIKRGGDYHTPDYNLSNTGLAELNFSGALGFSGNSKGLEIYFSSFNTGIGILRAAHTENLNDLQQSILSERPWYVKDFTYDIVNPKQKINHQLLKISSYFQLKNLGRLNILYGGQYNQRKEYDIRRGGRSDRPALSLSLLSNVIDVSLDHEKGKHSGSIGITGTLKFNQNDTETTNIRPLIPDYQQRSAGFFMLEKWRKDKLTLEAGGRYDYQYLKVLTFENNQTFVKPAFNFNYFSGTLGLSYLFNSRLRFVSNMGISSRPPHVSELYSEGLHHGTGSIEEGLMRQGNEVLTDQKLVRKEISKKWINTLQYTGKKLSFDFSLYYNAISNYIFIRPYDTRLTIRGYFPVFRFDQTDAVLTGGDAGLKWQINRRFSYSSKLAYIYARDVERNGVLIFIPPAQIENGLTYRIPSPGKLKDLFFNVSVPVIMEQSRAPRVVEPQNVADNTSDEIFDFAPAPQGYALLNARIGFKLPVNERTFSVTLSGENLLNKRYRNYMNRLRYYADEVGSNFMIRLSYNFYKH
jgi:iron complex outermembrane recepter protein